MKKYKCPNCGWVGFIPEMPDDYWYNEKVEDKVCVEFMCPECYAGDYEKGIDYFEESIK